MVFDRTRRANSGTLAPLAHNSNASHLGVQKNIHWCHHTCSCTYLWVCVCVCVRACVWRHTDTTWRQDVHTDTTWRQDTLARAHRHTHTHTHMHTHTHIIYHFQPSEFPRIHSSACCHKGKDAAVSTVFEKAFLNPASTPLTTPTNLVSQIWLIWCPRPWSDQRSTSCHLCYMIVFGCGCGHTDPPPQHSAMLYI